LLIYYVVWRRLLKESSQGEKSSELIFALILFICIIVKGQSQFHELGHLVQLRHLLHS